MTVDRKEYPHEMKSGEPERGKTVEVESSEKVYYSDLQVLESGAGYYIGRMGWVEDKKLGGYQEPYSRESGYYKTREAANKVLKSGQFDRGLGGAEIAFARSEGNLPPISEQYAYGPPRFRPGFQRLQRIIYVELPHGLDTADGHGTLFGADDVIKAVLDGYQRACPEGTKFSLDERAWSDIKEYCADCHRPLTEDDRKQYETDGGTGYPRICEDCSEKGQCAHAIRHLDNSCGAKVCVVCSDHEGLDRCFCGWARDGGDGKQQLVEMGETIEEE